MYSYSHTILNTLLSFAKFKICLHNYFRTYMAYFSRNCCTNLTHLFHIYSFTVCRHMQVLCALPQLLKQRTTVSSWNIFIVASRKLLYKVWWRSTKNELIPQINHTEHGDSCDECVLTCYCTPRCDYSSFHCFSQLWSAFKVKAILSYVILMMFESKEHVCIKFCNKIQKTVIKIYQLMQT
jgi:L-rhamnose mutarotase